MKSFTSFFEKYKNISPPDAALKSSVVFLFNKHFSYSLTKKQIKVRSRVIYVDCPSVIKSELALKKKEILSELSSLVAPRSVSDIR